MDQRILKEGLHALIDADQEFCCVEHHREGNVDVTIVDLVDRDPLTFAESSALFGSKLLVLAEGLQAAELEVLVQSDVRAVVAKTIDGQSLLGIMRVVANGGRWFDPQVAEYTRTEQLTELALKRRWGTLTDREREVAVLLMRGVPPSAVAARLGVSAHTVRGHRRSIYAKLHIGSRLELSLYALTADVG